MLFIDFDDAPTTETTQALFDRHVPTAVAWFDEVSYGRMRLDVTPIHSWYRMPETSDSYFPYSKSPYERLIQAALDAADADVDFSSYDIIYVMSSAGSKILSNPAFNTTPGNGAFADGNEFRNGVAFDGLRPWPETHLDRYAFTLIHETGHNLGLPDLYFKDGSPGDPHRNVGMWDIMGSHGNGTHFLAWHKFWLDWLPVEAVDCLGEGRYERILTPFTEPGFDAAIVKLAPDLAYVVEARAPVGFDELRDFGRTGPGHYGFVRGRDTRLQRRRERHTSNPPDRGFPCRRGD